MSCDRSDALTFESTNYNARVFLAVAKLNLGKLDESEQEYRKAIDAQPETPLAWQVCQMNDIFRKIAHC